jgi:hypothetical protein
VSGLDRVRVTRADVEDVVSKKSAGVPGVKVDAVVAKVIERLRDLVGGHTATSALRPETVYAWIEQQIDAALDLR